MRPTTRSRPREWMSFSATRWPGWAEHPNLGTPGKIPGTRELIPHESYRLVYEIEAETTVWILALVHTAMQWPPVRKE